MTDPTAIADVRVPDPSFMDDYDTGGTYVPPPTPKETVSGRVRFITFVAQAPGVDKINLKDANGNWLKTKDGYLKAVIEGIKLVDSGYEFGQTHIGTAQYAKYVKGQRTNELRNASPAMDYLHAHGIENHPSTPSDYETFFHATADRQFEVTIDWQAYDKDSQSDVAAKWEDFPLDPDNPGQRLPFIERGGKRFWARAQVKRYVSKV